ncbi:MAG: PIG-L family deacetylase, partial [Ornithinimicrobium sp.]
MIGLRLASDQPLRVLALGAHCDDIEIGAGGALLQWAAGPGGMEFGAYIATSTPQRAQESRSALAALTGDGAQVTISELRDTRLPADFDALKDELSVLAGQPWDVVLCPHADDAHQDHAILGRLTPTAFRDHLILRYEIPKWDGDLGSLQPNMYVQLSAEQLERKWQVLDEHYTSQRSREWCDFETISS